MEQALCFVLSTSVFVQSTKHKAQSTNSSLRARHVAIFFWFAPIDSISLADLLHVFASFPVRGYLSSVFHDCPLARIITRQNQIDPAAKHGHQLLQITRSAHDVFRRIIGSPYAQAPGS